MEEFSVICLCQICFIKDMVVPFLRYMVFHMLYTVHERVKYIAVQILSWSQGYFLQPKERWLRTATTPNNKRKGKRTRRRSEREEEKKQKTTTTMERKQGNTKGRKKEKKMHNKSVMSAELTYNFTEIGKTENKNRNK